MSEAKPTANEILWTIVGIVVAIVFTLLLAHQQEGCRVEEMAPLEDRLHAAIPQVQKARWVVHLLPLVAAILVLVHVPGIHAVRLVQVYALLLALRALTFWVTRLPAPRAGCKPYTMVGVRLGGCSDMMYSGHTTLLVLSTLFILFYGSSTWLKGVIAILAAAGVSLVLLTRHHYTADVMVAIIISTFAFLALRRR